MQAETHARISPARSQYRGAVSGVLALAEKDLQELRTYVQPPAAVGTVLAAVCVVLGLQPDWDTALGLLNHATIPFFTRIEGLDIASVRAARIAQLEQYVSLPDLQLQRVRSVSAAAHSLAVWVHAVHEHALVDTVRSAKRTQAQDALQRQLDLQVRLS
jgi:dynein heavy chain, axonemal